MPYSFTLVKINNFFNLWCMVGVVLELESRLNKSQEFVFVSKSCFPNLLYLSRKLVKLLTGDIIGSVLL